MEILTVTEPLYEDVLDVVYKSFNTFDAADYTENGRRSFMAYASLANFTHRQKKNHISFCLCEKDEIVGMIETRKNSHISMLFVAPKYIKKGYGRIITEHALDYMKSESRRLKRVTVNASPYAYGFYRHMGFTDTSPTLNLDGMIYTPMALRL